MRTNQKLPHLRMENPLIQSKPQKEKEVVILKLVEDIEGTLSSALEQSSHQKKASLTTLFQDLTNKIKKKYQDIFKDQNTNIHYYYEILADYYLKNSSQVEKIQNLCMDLTTNHFYPSIYALLFYKWLFSETPSLNKINLFLKGANRLFWSDIENKTFVYRGIFYYIKNSILNPKSETTNQDVVALVMKYYFYYHKSLKLVNTFIQNASKACPKAVEEVFLYEIFIRENIIMLESISDEEVMIKLLINLKHINIEKIDNKSKVKFQDALYTMTRPGPPFHPSRSVRHEANETLDTLFPGGKLARYVIGASFRLLHTWSWPKSLLLYVLEKIWNGVSFPYRFFHRLFNPDVFALDIEFDSDDIEVEFTKTETDTSDDDK